MSIRQVKKILIILLMVTFVACGDDKDINSYKTTYTLQTKLTALDGADEDQFGFSVAISDQTLVVGVPFDDDNGFDTGAIYMYKYGSSIWKGTKLTGGDRGDELGYSVAVSGNTIVVGDSYDHENGLLSSGAAYVYRYDGGSWKETKLSASDRAIRDQFGSSVAVSGDTIVVGALGDDDNVYNSGAVYIYRYDGSAWNETKLKSSDGAEDGWFGHSVAVSGDTVVVGAPFQHLAGAAYVYKYDGRDWKETKLSASDADGGNYFGYSVAVSGNTIVVGDPRADYDNGLSSGAVYIYRYDGRTWNETKLNASDADDGAEFGYSVAISGDTVVVGSPSDDEHGPLSGAAYVYRYESSSWDETKLTDSNGAKRDYFGHSVAISGNTIVVGIPSCDEKGPNSGSVFVYKATPRQR